ncbi:hypothetical protein KFL01_31810 [Kocuria flava]|uniref:Uncharacterized protein n=1 Tax=Kocuria flava TaxID=446860 RepID=A0ABQ0X8Y3_9MICC|nr:hypothetical protein KFL01_31810 [Kocuria flava]
MEFGAGGAHRGAEWCIRLLVVSLLTISLLINGRAASGSSTWQGGGVRTLAVAAAPEQCL